MPRLVNKVDPDIQQAVQKVNDHMDRLIRFQKESKRSLEQRIGLSSSMLSKLLKGRSRMTVEHLLQILTALEVASGAFLSWALPASGPPSPLLREAQSADEGLRPIAWLSPEQTDQLAARMLALLIRRAAEGGELE